ncbi:MAG: hypothetical protein WDZ62_02070 [Candidatus Pacearchaeota archaeon]
MSYLKRQKVPKNWPIPRKGTKYVVKPRVDVQKGVPLLVALRDILGVAQNRKEVKRIIHLKKILLNGRPARDEKNSVLLFDVITFVPSNKSYRVGLSGKGKIGINEIPSKESGTKISKIIGKKMLKGKKMQINLGDGRNYLSDIKCNTNDSVVIDLKNNKIKDHLPLKEKSKVLVFAGKHSGKNGVVNKIDEENNSAEITSQKEKITVLTKQLMVIN